MCSDVSTTRRQTSIRASASFLSFYWMWVVWETDITRSVYCESVFVRPLCEGGTTGQHHQFGNTAWHSGTRKQASVCFVPVWLIHSLALEAVLFLIGGCLWLRRTLVGLGCRVLDSVV